MPERRRAEMGAGTLIIFIALLLVAAVAASVIIQTAGSLQSKALATGVTAKADISTHVKLIAAYATNGTDGTLETFYGVGKLAAGSEPIKLDDVIITFSTADQSVQLSYSGNESYNSTNMTFGVHYLQQSTHYKQGLLQHGDLAEFRLEPGFTLSDGEYVRVTLIPKVGIPTFVEGDTPDVISTYRVELYP